MTTTSFIGAGNISQAIIGGYAAANPNTRIIASDPMAEQLAKLPASVETSQDNQFAVDQADVIVLCVKPNMMQTICQTLPSDVSGKLFISVAAGVTTASLSSWLGQGAAVVRCMPNTPALVSQGMTGLFAAQGVTSQQKEAASQVLGAVGKIQWFESESDLDAVTAISGSGPAYYFLVMQAMQAAGENLGLSAEVSRKLVLQTALGAAEMASQSLLSTEQLRINVTSPGGTTAAAIDSLQAEKLEDSFSNAIQAAFKRSIELSKPET